MFQPYSILEKQFCVKMINRLLISLSAILTLGILPQIALAQINQAKVTEIIDGEDVYIEKEPAAVEDTANLGQYVETEEARAGLEFNNGAAGRIGTNSQVIVGQCIDVQQGEILVSGPANGCIGGFSVGVQGTLYILETNADGTGNIKVLEGTVEITEEDEEAEPITLTEGQKISILSGILGEIQQITSEEFAAIVAGPLFSGFNIPITPSGLLQSTCSRLFPVGFRCSSNGVPTPIVPRPSVPTPSIPGPSIPGSPF
ncbi:MAG: hypothetical protein WBA13_11005 [Microcoleaceae cyanobacterium]